MTRPPHEVIRDLAELADRDGIGPVTLAQLAVVVTGTHIRAAEAALHAASVLRRLDDGTLDVTTLLDEPITTSLDEVREHVANSLEAELIAACRALAGETP